MPLNTDDFRNFLINSKKLDKAVQSHMVSINDFYTYLTGEKAFTPKTKQQTTKFKKWAKEQWRPFCKTLTQEFFNELEVEPILGREGYLSVFYYRKWHS